MANALYRKYRPKVFDDVYGQDHIVGTLKNQIKHDRVSHAYLFTGSRGTGKTTCAKIFARAINCLNPVDGSPCGKCECCKALEGGNNIDIMEIDAASNNGVDDAREIRERVKYAPVHGRYKVYIIDEVHMLSGAAFNALLKTLEEPPAHAVFILATTEVHKLPATILSRCMRFDFRLIGVEELTENLKRIFDKEGKAYEEDAVRFIARAGEGSVRDMLSVADICFNATEGKLTLADVMRVTGGADRDSIRSLFHAIQSSDISGIFSLIDGLAGGGKSMSLIAKELLRYARDLLVVKTGNTRMIIDTEESIARMSEDAKECEVAFLTAVIGILSEADAALRYSVSPRIALETVCLKAALLSSSDYNALEQRISRLENGMHASVSAPAAPPVKESVSAPKEHKTPQTAPPDALSLWGKLVTYMREHESMKLYSLLGSHSDVETDGDKLIVWCNDDNYLTFSEPETAQAVRRALADVSEGTELVIDKRKRADSEKLIDKIKSMMSGVDVKIKRKK
ncbi:MAG: DNA polymerase III subunit gamma/tau [Clostridia bacterium]|nr:DNA polymerase III subunit gamma/tau [Clostridia bacterium]